MKTRAIARFGLLTAAALILGYVESLLPLAPGLPGVKLGLGNAAVLCALYTLSPGAAWAMTLLKALLSALLFSGPAALWYSLAGAVVSMGVMQLTMKRVPLLAQSALGALGHNAGQLLAAYCVVGRAVFAYAPVLVLSALASGLLIGVVVQRALAILSKHSF